MYGFLLLACLLEGVVIKLSSAVGGWNQETDMKTINVLLKFQRKKSCSIDAMDDRILSFSTGLLFGKSRRLLKWICDLYI